MTTRLAGYQVFDQYDNEWYGTDKEVYDLVCKTRPGDARKVYAVADGVVTAAAWDRVRSVRNHVHGMYKALPTEWHDFALEIVSELSAALEAA